MCVYVTKTPQQLSLTHSLATLTQLVFCFSYLAMGNASGKSDEEGPCGVKYGEEEEISMEFAPQSGTSQFGYHVQGVYADTEPMSYPPLHTPSGYSQFQTPLVFNPQTPMNPLARTVEVMPTQNYSFPQRTTDSQDVCNQNLTSVMITWSYGGKDVAVTGSWDNWTTREPLKRSWKEFIITKALPSGVYHYRFIVDEHVRYDPDLPWVCDDSGVAYNILDVKDYVPEAPENLSAFEPPPSPESSYSNEFLDDMDLSKPPPDMPPQLHLTLLNERSSETGNHESQSRPRHTVLNHLYIQNDRNNPVALGSTHRFLQKIKMELSASLAILTRNRTTDFF